MWLENDTFATKKDRTRYCARRLWTAYALFKYQKEMPLRLLHIQGLMRKWNISWEQLTTQCTAEHFDEAVAWWVARRLGQ